LKVPPAPSVSGDALRAYGKQLDAVFWSDTRALEAHFSFTDKQSGITHLEVAIFRRQGADEVRFFPVGVEWLRTSDGPQIDGRINLTTWTGQVDVASRIEQQLIYLTIRVPVTLCSGPISTGSQYFFRARAYNQAGTMSSADSSGVLIDDTPPIMDEVFVGVLAKEPENVRQEAVTGAANIVITADPRGVKARWGAFDPESGIAGYQVAVGSIPVANPLRPYFTPNGTVDRYTGVRAFRLDCPGCSPTALTLGADSALTSGPFAGFIDAGDKTAMYIDMSPNSFEVASLTQRYAVTARAANQAQLSSERASKAIRVARKDVAGIVYDGPDAFQDISLQTGDSITVNFFGWESDYCGGLMGFEWAVGSVPEMPDEQEFVPYGLVMEGDHGVAQAVTPGLRHNQTYFTTVRGITLCRVQSQSQTDAISASQGPTNTKAVEFLDTGREFIESVSSGVLVDKTAPQVVTAPLLTAPPRYGTALYRAVASGQPVTLPSVDLNGIIHVRVFAESGRQTEYFVNVQPTPASQLVALANLTLVRAPGASGVTLPAFSPLQLSYNVTVPFVTRWITLRATQGQSGQQLQMGMAGQRLSPVGSGTESQQFQLREGSTCLATLVLSEDRLQSRTYTVCVRRLPASTLSLPSSLSLLWGTARWNSTAVGAIANRSTFNISIPFRFAAVQLVALLPAAASRAFYHAGKLGSATASLANVMIATNRTSSAIPVGASNPTVITLTVVAEDGVTTTTVTLTVSRAAPEASTSLVGFSATLPESQPGLPPTVEAEAAGYVVTVDAACSAVLIGATPASNLSQISFRGVLSPILLPTRVAPNNITNSTIVAVVAESGAQQLYRVRFARRNLSTDATLVSGCTLRGRGRDQTQPFAESLPTVMVNGTLVAANVPFAWHTLLILCRPTHPLANVSFSYDDFGIATFLGMVQSNASFVLARPPVMQTIPLRYVPDLRLVVAVIAEDGVTLNNVSMLVSYALPDSSPRLARLTADFAFNSTVRHGIVLSPSFNPNTTRYTGSVPFSVGNVSIQFAAAAFGTARVRLPGRQESDAMAAGEVSTSVFAGNTEILVEVTAQDGLATQTITVSIAQLLVSNDTGVSVTVAAPVTHVLSTNAVNGARTLQVAFPFATEHVSLTVATPLFASLVSSDALSIFDSVTSNNATGVTLLARILNLTFSTRLPAALSVTAEDGATVTTYAIEWQRLPGSNDCSTARVWVFTPLNDTNVSFVPTSLSHSVTVNVSFSTASVVFVLAPSSSVATARLVYFALNRPLLARQASRVALSADLASTVTLSVTSESASCTQTISVLIARLPQSDVLAQPASITVAGYPLSPAFAGSVYEYSIGAARTSDLTVTVTLPSNLFHASISVGVVERLSGDYTVAPDALQYSYDVQDPESGIANKSSSVFLYSPGVAQPMVVASRAVAGSLTELFSQLSISSANVTSTQLGLPFGVTLAATNVFGAEADAVSNMVTFDPSPPVTANASIACPQFTAETAQLSCRWYGFSDKESSIAYFLISIGRSRGDSSVFLSTPIGWRHAYTAVLDKPLQHGDTVFVTLTAVNPVGMLASVTSAPVLVDTTPPIATGRVWELGDVAVFAPSSLVRGSGEYDAASNASEFAFNTLYRPAQRVVYNGTVFRPSTVFDSGLLTPQRRSALAVGG
jgi:hypothetical protein